LALPAWFAVTVQVPPAKVVIVVPFVPDAPQTPPGLALKVTGLPEPPPVALTLKGGSV
jgi:hypothetical protein